MIRPATPADIPEIEGFLAPRAGTSMFLRGNIAGHGVMGGDHPHATTIHVAPASGPIGAVFGRTAGGMLMLQAPEDCGETAAWAGTLRDLPVAGMTGEAGQVGRLLEILAVPKHKVRADLTEPLMTRLLADLPQLPAGMSLRAAAASDIPLLTGWFGTYTLETGLGAVDPAAAKARAHSAVGSTVRLLEHHGQPVAMAALNARAGADVQVGGVFVPAALRNRGFGRLATRALLAEAAGEGAARAFLFSNNDAATRAYRAIGFAPIGQFRIVLLS